MTIKKGLLFDRSLTRLQLSNSLNMLPDIFIRDFHNFFFFFFLYSFLTIFYSFFFFKFHLFNAFFTYFSLDKVIFFFFYFLIDSTSFAEMEINRSIYIYVKLGYTIYEYKYMLTMFNISPESIPILII